MAHLKAAVLDWAGTVIDHGSRAPVEGVVQAFAGFGVAISAAEARGPMGLAKHDHIRALLAQPRIAAAWETAQGAAPDDAAIDRIHAAFLPMAADAVAARCQMIQGAVPAIERLRMRGLKIGATTGYSREIMARLLPEAARQGYVPDALVCAGDLATGRPAPLMMYRCFVELGVWPAHAVVKVDDTEAGLAEGLAAGSWAVGVALTGNEFGLSPEETAALAPEAHARLRARAVGRLAAAGAHYVIDSIAEIDPVIDAIEGRLARGERP